MVVEAPGLVLWRLILRRLLAGLIDGALIAAPVAMVLLSLITYDADGKGFGALVVVLAVAFLATALAAALPPTAAAAFANRRSPGRRVARLDVVDTDGEPVHPWVAGARMFAFVVGFAVPYVWLVAVPAAVVTLVWKRATWWDLVTRTRLVPSESRSPSPQPATGVGASLRSATGWLIAVPSLMTAVVVGVSGGDEGPVLLACVVVAGVLWLLWRMPHRWAAPTVFLALTAVALSPGVVRDRFSDATGLGPLSSSESVPLPPASPTTAPMLSRAPSTSHGLPAPHAPSDAGHDIGMVVASHLTRAQRMFDPTDSEQPGALDRHSEGRIDKRATMFTPLTQLRDAEPEWRFAIYDLDSDLVAEFIEVTHPPATADVWCVAVPPEPGGDFTSVEGECEVAGAAAVEVPWWND